MHLDVERMLKAGAGRNETLARSFRTRPDAKKGTSHEISDFLSHRTDRWAVDLLPRGWAERRADLTAAARFAVFFANVRAALHTAVGALSPGRSRLPRLRTQRLA